MERRGSGMKKIINTYRRYEHLSDYHAPAFTSNASEFHVTLWNLNYKGELMEELTPDNIPLIQEFVKDNGEVVVKEFVKASRQIYKLISQNPPYQRYTNEREHGDFTPSGSEIPETSSRIRKDSSCRWAKNGRMEDYR